MFEQGGYSVCTSVIGNGAKVWRFRRVDYSSGTGGRGSKKDTARPRRKEKARARMEVPIPRRRGGVPSDSDSSQSDGERGEGQRSPARVLSSRSILGQRRSQGVGRDAKEGSRGLGGIVRRASSKSSRRSTAVSGRDGEESVSEEEGGTLVSSATGENILENVDAGLRQMKEKEAELAALLAAAVKRREREERRAREREEAERKWKAEEEAQRREEEQRREEQRRREEAQARRASRQQSQSSSQSQGRVPPSPSQLSS